MDSSGTALRLPGEPEDITETIDDRVTAPRYVSQDAHASSNTRLRTLFGSLSSRALSEEKEAISLETGQASTIREVVTPVGAEQVGEGGGKALWKRVALAGPPPVSLPDDDEEDADLKNLKQRAGKAFQALLSTYEETKQKPRKKDLSETDSMFQAEYEHNVEQRETLVSLRDIVGFKISQNRKYKELAFFLLYMILYSAVIGMMRDTDTSFSVERSLLDLFEQPLPGMNMASDDVLNWIDTVSAAIFKDPTCGDGVCDFPSEYAGFGRFGCPQDCGSYANTTTHLISFKDQLVPDGQKIEDQPFYQMAATQDFLPDFRFNIWSDRVQDWIFADDVVAEGGTTFEFQVPDSNLSLCMFQRTKKYYTRFSPETVAVFLNLQPTTMPSPEPTYTWAYGFWGEALAWNAMVITFLYTDPSNPANTTSYVRSPALDQGLRYGIGYTFGFSSLKTGYNIIDGGEVPACSVEQADLERGALDGYCNHRNSIFPLEKRCYDAAEVGKTWNTQCQSCRTYERRLYSTDPGETLPDIVPDQAPLRAVTPNNLLIGSVLISQKRRMRVPCDLTGPAKCEEGSCAQNRHILNVLLQDGTCLSKTELDRKPFGIDPAFLSTSSLFDGRLKSSSYYNSNETDPAGVPYGFFAYAYNLSTTSFLLAKNDEANQYRYRVYLDSRMSGAQVKTAVQFLREGNYITNLTESIAIEMGTFNAQHQHFSWNTITFSFESGGILGATVSVRSFSMTDFMTEREEIVLFVIILTLSLRILWSEILEMQDAYRHNNFRAYFADFWNLLDWLSFVSVPISLLFLQLSGSELVNHLSLGNQTTIPRVLKHPGRTARRFETDAQAEEQFLVMRHNIEEAMFIAEVCRAWAGFNILLLSARFFKLLHFQGRMGLLTRTLGRSLMDLAHFTIILLFVIFMYGLMGRFMFGSQLPEYKTLVQSMMTLICITLSLDVTYFNRLLGVSPSMDFIVTIYWLTFLFISMVVLLNIFLAILVDSFALVKETAHSSETLWEGYKETFGHDMWDLRERVLSNLSFLDSSQRDRFVSNARMYELLEAWIHYLNEISGIVDSGQSQKGLNSHTYAYKHKHRHVIQLSKGEEMTEMELCELLLTLIAESPEKISRHRRKVWLKMKQNLSRRLSSSNSDSDSQRGLIAEAPSPMRALDIEGGQSPGVRGSGGESPVRRWGAQPVQPQTPSGPRFGSLPSSPVEVSAYLGSMAPVTSVDMQGSPVGRGWRNKKSFWSQLAHDAKDEGPPAQPGGWVVPDHVAVEKRIKDMFRNNSKFVRLTKQIMNRFGTNPESEAQAEEALKVLKAHMTEKQIDMFERMGRMERTLAGMQKKVDQFANIASKMDSLAEKMDNLANMPNKVDSFSNVAKQEDTFALLASNVDNLASFARQVDKIAEKVDSLTNTAYKVDSFSHVTNQEDKFASLVSKVDNLTNIASKVDRLEQTITAVAAHLGVKSQ